MTARSPISSTPWAANIRPVTPAVQAEVLAQWRARQTMGQR